MMHSKLQRKEVSSKMRALQSQSTLKSPSMAFDFGVRKKHFKSKTIYIMWVHLLKHKEHHARLFHFRPQSETYNGFL